MKTRIFTKRVEGSSNFSRKGIRIITNINSINILGIDKRLLLSNITK